ncbi:MAG: hypothetical protein QOH48_2352 [Actinomycetota bacterium]|jgi:hypothetical protein|nr:hypothetical protein [Actinomycetota bacterium]
MANKPAAPIPMSTEELAPWGVLAAGLLIMLGSILPWAPANTIFGSFSVAGTAGDGKITLACGLLIATLAGIYLTGNVARKTAR